MSGKTKADLEAELEEERGTTQDLRRKLYEAEAKTPATPKPVPEAEALASAIRAFDNLKNSDGNGRGDLFGYGTSSTPIRRVLIALADRYGVQLIETRFEPCSRRHLDEATSAELATVVANGGVFR